jgi:enoyl-CoA hydratase/carnithine racemase
MLAGGGPMAWLPQLIGRNRALEVLLSSEDLRGDQAEAYGYVNRALPDDDLDAFVEALATRIARFGKRAIANTKPPRQHQPAARGRTWRRVGCMHRFAGTTRRPGRD